jgi:DNA polymerase-1
MKIIRKPFNPDYILVDGNALAFRSFFSHEKLSVKIKKKRVYTGMAYGFVRMLLSIKKQYPSAKFIVAWDGGYKRKKEIYPDYKAKRTLSLGEGISFKDLISSFESCRKLLKHIGIPQYRIFGEEGDDILSSIVFQNPSDSFAILTNDHDMFQLLTLENVRFVIRMRPSDTVYWCKRKFIEEHQGLHPRFYPHFLAIVGDSTDNIPGIRGIGEKKAAPIMRQLDPPTLENLYNRINEIEATTNIRQKLIDGKDDAEKFLQIVKLREDLPIDEPIHTAKLNEARLIKYLTKLKFKSILSSERDMSLLCDLSI